jgi:hypothetical protein
MMEMIIHLPKNQKEMKEKVTRGTAGKNDAEAGTSSQYYGKQQAVGGMGEGLADKEETANKEHTNQTAQPEKEIGGVNQNEKDKAPELNSSQESEDSIGFEELLSPGGKHWNFGTFQQEDIRNIYRMQLNETNSIVVNEYGTNLVKRKMDPLMVIEAKNAMSKSEQVAEKTQGESLQEEMEDGGGGTQEAPGMENLSQEENHLSQDAIMVGGSGETLVKDKIAMTAQDSALLITDEAVLDPVIPGKETMTSAKYLVEHGEGIEDPASQSTSSDWDFLADEESAENMLMKETQDEEVVDEAAQIEKGKSKHIINSKGGKPVRQSERIKKQDNGGVKITEKAERAAKKRNLEGNSFVNKNSFAVLDSLEIINKFSKMGGNSISVTMEHIDLLKDLEMARNNVRERLEEINRDNDEGSVAEPSLEEVKLIEWKSDSSDVSDLEGYHKISRRKNKKGKKKKSPKKVSTPKGQSFQPDDGIDCLEGDIPR